jgi:ribosomal protein L29
MKLVDITQKSDKELATLLADSRQELAQARVDMRSKQASNVKQIAAVRKRVARILTIQKNRELETVTSTKEETNG